jgi:hypothetical protein
MFFAGINLHFLISINIFVSGNADGASPGMDSRGGSGDSP